MQLEILRRIGGAYLVRQNEAYHMAYPEAGYYTTIEAAEAFLDEKAEDFQAESPTLERIAALLADPEARRERPEWAKADFSADCYLLDEAHVTPFLPFLYPSGREDAQKGRIRVIGAAKNGAAIGALAFSTAAETAVIQSIAVSPEYQRKGFALDMLQYLRDVLPLLDCWEITATLAPDLPGREAVEAILKQTGFQQEQGPALVDCSLSAFQAAASLQPFFPPENRKKAIPLSRVPDLSRRALNVELQEKGAAALDWEHFDPDLSFCGLPDGTSISCCVGLSRRENGVQVEWLYVRANAARTMAEVLAAAISAAVEAYGPEGRCTAVLVNDAAGTLLEKLVGRAAQRTETLRWRLPLLSGEAAEDLE